MKKKVEEFYLHERMSDGHINACKDCVKRDVRVKSRSPKGRLYDHQRNAKPKRRKWRREYVTAWEKRNPKKHKAHKAILDRIYKGRLKRGKCEECGKPNAHAHHPNYNKPLKVVWLCPPHHRAKHKQFHRKDA